MSLLHFSSFTFDTVALELKGRRSRQTQFSLRPKTAELLRVLITQRNNVISKQDLIRAVWQSDQVVDQNLFQAMSELRRVLSPLTPIKTFPSRGYQWVEPVRAVSPHSLRWYHQIVNPRNALAASVAGIALGAIALVGLTQVTVIPNDAFSTAREAVIVAPIQVAQNSDAQKSMHSGSTLVAQNVSAVDLPPLKRRYASRLQEALHTPTPTIALPASVSLTPALIAFANGVTKLQNGDAAGANAMFILSANENPHFNEAKLLLAETYLRQGQPLTARQQGLDIIHQQASEADAYTLVSAMDLVSRSEQLLGKNNAAMEWALEAASQAADEGFVCTAVDLRERFEYLKALADITSTEPVDSPVVLRATVTSAKSHSPITAANDQSPPQHCAQLRDGKPEAALWVWPVDSAGLAHSFDALRGESGRPILVTAV